MEAIAIVTVLALMQVFMFALQVGKARASHEISAPAITGNAEFERVFRVHQNTVEQIVLFVPALWLFGYYVHPLIGAAVGLGFIVSRQIYRNAYVRDPVARGTGFGLGALMMAILLFGGLGGAALSWYRG